MALRNFPVGPQTEFYNAAGPLFQGVRYAVDPYRDSVVSGLIRNVTEVPQINTATVTYGSAGNVGVVIDGFAITAVAAVDSNTTAAAIDAAFEAYFTTYGRSVIASAVTATNVVTITFADAFPHTVTALDSGTTTIAIASSQAAASYSRLNFGLGVTTDTGGGFDLTGPSLRCIRGATGGSDVLLGVLAYDIGTQMSDYQVTALGFESGYLAPVNPYMVITKGSVVVPWVGTLPTGPSSAVYWINAPATLSQRGKFRSDANGGEADLVSAYVEGVIPDANLVKVRFDL